MTKSQPKSSRRKVKSQVKKTKTKKSLKSSAKLPVRHLLKRRYNKLLARRDHFLSRRPHRSFKRTKRRDYVRSLELPGYFRFTHEVVLHLSRHKEVFLRLVLLYAILSAILGGVVSQSGYRDAAQMVDDVSENVFTGGWGEIGKAGVLALSGMSGNFGQSPSEAQQIYIFMIFLMTWLTTVWLMRTQLAGKRPRLRDGLYNSGAPIFAMMVIGLLLIVQLIPATLGVIAYSSLMSSGGLDLGALAMVVFFIVAALFLLSIYLISSTFFAMIVVTLPGMYPWRAVQIAGDLVTGRRLRILLRMVWAVLCVLLVVFTILIPIFLGINWLQSAVSLLKNIPIIPLVLLASSSISTVFLAAYTYLLYRKVIDDDASPA